MIDICQTLSVCLVHRGVSDGRAMMQKDRILEGGNSDRGGRSFEAVA